MRTINIHKAKTHLSRLVEEAAMGEAFIIAKAGRPIAKVTALDPVEPLKARRFDFLKGEFQVPDDFDRLYEHEIVALFEGDDDSAP
ncbi:MAG: type II toxin-antitoxin system prevent-host-death family antitoxin [Rhizobiaceae bacterium]|nr:type II toxin-antitoxin system prevent-host-death family antitoxin [Rhizobiaceae bacterium]